MSVKLFITKIEQNQKATLYSEMIADKIYSHYNGKIRINIDFKLKISTCKDVETDTH